MGLRLFGTVCKSFESIALVYTEKKRVKVSAGNWSKMKGRQNRSAAVTAAFHNADAVMLQRNSVRIPPIFFRDTCKTECYKCAFNHSLLKH